MSKNLIPEIAQMLGVEIGEAFKIKEYGERIYRFANSGLQLIYDNGMQNLNTTANMALSGLLSGELEIIKLPWRPKIYDIYWTFKAAHIDVWCITDTHWTNNPNDVAAFKNGWVYRSKKEAEAALPKVAAEFDVKYKL